MNCKPGDLAVVVRSPNGINLGKVVRVLRLHSSTTHDLDGIPFNDASGPRWVIDPPLSSRHWTGRIVPLFTAGDIDLRPIRDQDGEDETLTWAGKPSDIKTPEAA